MFTREEKDFIDSSPEFISILRSMTDKEVSAFTEIVTYICDLSPAEKETFCRKVDCELAKMKRPSRIDFAKMVAREIETGKKDLSMLDPDYLEDCYKRYMKGDLTVLSEVKAAVAEKKMEKAVKTPPSEMLQALKNKGFEDSFLKEYRSEIFTQKNIDGFSAGDPAVMETIENYHDEWVYFNCGCTGDDDIIVAMTNEAWLPDEE